VCQIDAVRLGSVNECLVSFPKHAFNAKLDVLTFFQGRDAYGA
jgi:hypothetical protein